MHFCWQSCSSLPPFTSHGVYQPKSWLVQTRMCYRNSLALLHLSTCPDVGCWPFCLRAKGQPCPETGLGAFRLHLVKIIPMTKEGYRVQEPFSWLLFSSASDPVVGTPCFQLSCSALYQYHFTILPADSVNWTGLGNPRPSVPFALSWNRCYRLASCIQGLYI